MGLMDIAGRWREQQAKAEVDSVAAREKAERQRTMEFAAKVLAEEASDDSPEHSKMYNALARIAVAGEAGLFNSENGAQALDQAIGILEKFSPIFEAFSEKGQFNNLEQTNVVKKDPEYYADFFIDALKYILLSVADTQNTDQLNRIKAVVTTLCGSILTFPHKVQARLHPDLSKKVLDPLRQLGVAVPFDFSPQSPESTAPQSNPPEDEGEEANQVSLDEATEEGGDIVAEKEPFSLTTEVVPQDQRDWRLEEHFENIDRDLESTDFLRQKEKTFSVWLSESLAKYEAATQKQDFAEASTLAQEVVMYLEALAANIERFASPKPQWMDVLTPDEATSSDQDPAFLQAQISEWRDRESTAFREHFFDPIFLTRELDKLESGFRKVAEVKEKGAWHAGYERLSLEKKLKETAREVFQHRQGLGNFLSLFDQVDAYMAFEAETKLALSLGQEPPPLVEKSPYTLEEMVLLLAIYHQVFMLPNATALGVGMDNFDRLDVIVRGKLLKTISAEMAQQGRSIATYPFAERITILLTEEMTAKEEPEPLPKPPLFQTGPLNPDSLPLPPGFAQ